MKRILMLSITIAICAPVAWFTQARRSDAHTNTFTPTIAPSFADGIAPTFAGTLEEIGGTLLNNAEPASTQQVGVRCKAYPTCPDCGGGGNVCRGAEEFYPGITAVVAKRDIIARCRRANGLDYCGGSRGCMKKSPAERKRHMEQYGGGCYRQCEKVAGCYIDNR